MVNRWEQTDSIAWVTARERGRQDEKWTGETEGQRKVKTEERDGERWGTELGTGMGKDEDRVELTGRAKAQGLAVGRDVSLNMGKEEEIKDSIWDENEGQSWRTGKMQAQQTAES